MTFAHCKLNLPSGIKVTLNFKCALWYLIFDNSLSVPTVGHSFTHMQKKKIFRCLCATCKLAMNP